MNNPTCAIESLSKYVPSTEQSWNEQRIKHLYRRLSYSAALSAIEAAKNKTPEQLVDELIDGAMTAPFPDKPVWVDWNYRDFENQAATEAEREELINQAIFGWLKTWISDMMKNDVLSVSNRFT